LNRQPRSRFSHQLTIAQSRKKENAKPHNAYRFDWPAAP
jgi:hypothetical protein